MTDQWGRRLFTIGGVLLLLLGLVHSLSLFEEIVPVDETEGQLLGLMASYKLNLIGSMRSMDDLLRGFSISFMLTAFVLGAIDLVLCCERAGLLKRVALVNLMWLAAMIAVSLRYFFAMPTSFLIVAFLIFGLAWLKLPQSVS